MINRKILMDRLVEIMIEQIENDEAFSEYMLDETDLPMGISVTFEFNVLKHQESDQFGVPSLTRSSKFAYQTYIEKESDLGRDRHLMPVSGSKTWYNKDYNRNRVDGPAYENTHGTKEWYKNGEFHRFDGPALVSKAFFDDGERIVEHWFIDGKEISDDRLAEITERHQLNPDWKMWTDAEKTLFRLAV
jgi:hypothetical protein